MRHSGEQDKRLDSDHVSSYWCLRTLNVNAMERSVLVLEIARISEPRTWALPEAGV